MRGMAKFFVVEKTKFEEGYGLLWRWWRKGLGGVMQLSKKFEKKKRRDTRWSSIFL